MISSSMRQLLLASVTLAACIGSVHPLRQQCSFALSSGLQPPRPAEFLLNEYRGGAVDSSSFIGRIMRSWRESENPDSIGGGLIGRFKRFIGGLFGSAPVTKMKAKKKLDKHLTKSYRKGQANYRIQKELRDWLANPIENLNVAVGDNIRVWVVTLTGAKGTIYAGEKYKLKFTFPLDYPSKPPSVYFLQPTPRHEHVYTNGDICLNLLGRDWRPNMTASTLALSILSMLSSAKEKKIPQDNQAHADAPPGRVQENWLYHDDKC